ncbi:DUF5330 domain-containing protein [Taklimakanibacter lacteus]|uniref:DUF5330 domain-containing protein n=1 Tax=Taklimakanibacter lacteus TaxID=2268456 RepID=UPI000E674F00
MRIFRTIFFLGVAAYFLPSPPENRTVAVDAGSEPAATEYLTAAVSTFADMRGFCARQAAVCDTAHYLAVKLEGKAKYSIELIYEWARESNGAALPLQAADSDRVPASGFASAGDETRVTGQNTLQLEDLIPEWRAPKSAGQG